MADTVTARARHEFSSLRPEAVYAAWTDPALVRKWSETHAANRSGDISVTTIEIDLRVGGRFMFAETRQGEEERALGAYTLLDHPHRLAFTWFVSEEEEAEATSLVTIMLTPQGEGCLATVDHEMDAAWEDYLAQTAAAWAAMLKAIDEALGG